MRRKPVSQLALAAVLVALSNPALSCPAFLSGKALSQSTGGGARADWRLFTRTGGTWSSEALQVDPMDKTGALIVPAEGEVLASKPLTTDDRVTFRPERFGQRFDGQGAFPCRTERLHEVQDKTKEGRFAYVARCDDPAGATRYTGGQPVRHLEGKRQIGSSLFDYVYQPNNQLVFDQLNVRVPGQAKPVVGARGADILLHLDVKNFLTLEFTNDNVQSFVESSHKGDVGMVGLINFYLKVLFFKIDLHMATTASWYQDAANLPMLIDVPVDAPSKLNAGSGMLFNWLPADSQVFANDPRSTVPHADPATILKGWQAHAARGLAKCSGDPCMYRLVGAIGSEAFTIDMIVPRDLVSKGFYPSWSGDLSALKVGNGWESEGDDADKGRVAMYFETSGLPKGKYKMDYWIRMGGTQTAGVSCPAPVQVTNVIPAPAVGIAH